MSDGKYSDWFDTFHEENVKAFIEKMSDEFEEFCQDKYVSDRAGAEERKREIREDLKMEDE